MTDIPSQNQANTMHAKPNRDTVPQVINGRINGRFAPGFSGNPGGSPEAARKALNKDTILEMHRAFKLANDGHDTRALQHYFVGLAGAGKLGTTSASPSITFAASPACAANIALIAAMASSISSSLIALTPPECSNFISRGTRSAQIFRYAAGCVLRPSRWLAVRGA